MERLKAGMHSLTGRWTCCAGENAISLLLTVLAGLNLLLIGAHGDTSRSISSGSLTLSTITNTTERHTTHTGCSHVVSTAMCAVCPAYAVLSTTRPCLQVCVCVCFFLTYAGIFPEMIDLNTASFKQSKNKRRQRDLSIAISAATTTPIFATQGGLQQHCDFQNHETMKQHGSTTWCTRTQAVHVKPVTFSY